MSDSLNEEQKKTIKSGAQKRTLETDIIEFTDTLPYFARFLSEKILSGTLKAEHHKQAYNFLLEDAQLLEKSGDRPEIIISCSNNNRNFQDDLTLCRISGVRGINALVPDQELELTNGLTIVYGANGSGKSGYIRLMNNVFITKGEKTILPNVHSPSTVTQSAQFEFLSAGKSLKLQFPSDCSDVAFKQFSVFDEKAVHAHLNNKNQFEFRPSGLAYFAELNDAYKKIEELLAADIQARQHQMDLTALFDGDSIIKTMVGEITAKTRAESFEKLRTFSDNEKAARKGFEEQKAALMALKKDKEISDLENHRTQLGAMKKGLELANRFFSDEQLKKASEKIGDCLTKEKLAATNNIEKFETEHLKSIGSQDWRNFIIAADAFARQQDNDGTIYPNENDICLLCHQPVDDKARALIASYWTFIKSKAEQESKDAQAILELAKSSYDKLELNLLPDISTLYKWLLEQYPTVHKVVLEDIKKLNELKELIVGCINNKVTNEQKGYQANVQILDELRELIDDKINSLRLSDVSKQIEDLQQKIVYLNHQEKLSDHFSKIEARIKDLDWVAKAQKAKIGKRELTNKEKDLSGLYFNQAYIDKFNAECTRLNGDFGISINHTGAGGTSFRQLNLKNKKPTEVLSEGEQKVISLADFLSENILSGVNRGMIFDDPVTSLDEERKGQIAERLAEESTARQIIIFTHDLIFVSQLISVCQEKGKQHECHWIEQRGGKPGFISLRNAPSYEKSYKTAEKPNNFYLQARKEDCPASMRELLIQQGFTALRTCYETLVVFGLFQGVVQRFEERVSVDSLKSVNIDNEMKDELMESFYKCCRFMEGHSHSDRYAYKKPKVEDLDAEIKVYDSLRLKIQNYNKQFKK